MLICETAAIQREIHLTLTFLSNLALSQPCSEILRGRSCSSYRISTQQQCHLQRSQARESAAGQEWPCQDYRFRFRQRRARHHLDALRNARLSCTGSRSLEGLQQIRGLVGHQKMYMFNLLTVVQVVHRHPHLRNALRFHTLLGRRQPRQDLREHSQGPSQVPTLHPQGRAGPPRAS